MGNRGSKSVMLANSITVKEQRVDGCRFIISTIIKIINLRCILRLSESFNGAMVVFINLIFNNNIYNMYIRYLCITPISPHPFVTVQLQSSVILLPSIMVGIYKKRVFISLFKIILYIIVFFINDHLYFFLLIIILIILLYFYPFIYKKLVDFLFVYLNKYSVYRVNKLKEKIVKKGSYRWFFFYSVYIFIFFIFFIFILIPFVLWFSFI